MRSFKKDIVVEWFADVASVQLVSEDARAWVEENYAPGFNGDALRLPVETAEVTLEKMREDGLSE